MSELKTIVFARGQNEAIDPRVLPDDQHKTVQNVRFRKDGRPQKRPGFTNLSLTGLFVFTPYINLLAEIGGTQLVGTSGQLSTYRGTTWKNVTLETPLAAYGPGERTPLMRTEQTGLLPAANGATVAYSAAGKLVYAWGLAAPVNTQYTTATTGGIIGQTNSLGANVSRPRLLTVNGNTYLFSLNAGTLNVQLYNTSTELFGSATALQTVTGGGSYDVCAHGTTEFVVIWQSSLIQLSIARYSAVATPTIVGSAVTVATNSSAQYPAIACTSTSSIFFAWLETTATPSFRFGAYDSTLTTLTGAATTISTTAGLFDQPGIAVVTNTTADMFCGKYVAPTCFLQAATVTSAGAISASPVYTNVRLSSKPFTGPRSGGIGNTTYLWTHSPEGPAWDDQRNLTLQRFNNALSRQALVPNCFGAEVYSGGAPTGNTHLADVVDTSVGVFTIQRTQLRQLASASSVQLFGLDAISVHSILESQFWAARDVAMAGKALLISGGVLMEHTGKSPAYTGLSTQPVIVSATATAGGALTVGTYLYKATFENIDSAGRRTRSATSDPVSATTAGANLSVTLLLSPAVGEALTNTGYTIHVYRTLVGQSTYHRVTPNSGAPITVGSESSNITFVDTMADSVAASTEFIYTDGGVLDNVTPPACSFMCVCNGRVWLGGQFDRTVITASKTLIDGEPAQFSGLSAFSVSLPRKCTGLASIDGTLVAFSADAVYLVTGDGPNNQGVGAFNQPSALPVDGGCVDWRSVVETSVGVFFQSQRGIMLLPRGFGAPEFVGAPVEDTLSRYPYVMSATLVAPTNGDETTVRFCCNDNGGLNIGAVLVYSVRTGGWIVDVLSFSSTVTGPGGTWLGRYVQSVIFGGNALVHEELPTATYSDGISTFIPSILATGDVRPFGVAGYGNFNEVTVMGEYRGNANVVVSVSVDGVTADSYTFAVTSADAADGVVYLGVTPKIRKGCSIAITVQDAAIGGTPTEGFIAQAVFLEVEAMPNGKRLAAARRA